MRKFYIYFMLAMIWGISLAAQADANPSTSHYAKGRAVPRRPQRLDEQDKEMNRKRSECDTTLRREGGSCTESTIALENCVLRCMSSACYNEGYGDDALEEGEVDVSRGRAYRACVRAEIRRAEMLADGL